MWIRIRSNPKHLASRIRINDADPGSKKSAKIIESSKHNKSFLWSIFILWGKKVLKIWYLEPHLADADPNHWSVIIVPDTHLVGYPAGNFAGYRISAEIVKNVYLLFRQNLPTDFAWILTKIENLRIYFYILFEFLFKTQSWYKICTQRSYYIGTEYCHINF